MIKLEEQGRSMVEMLGVLAVMGVLSVGGVAMYTSAMNKHRANELLNAVSVRATALASQRMTGKALSLAGFTDNTQGTSVIDVNSSNADAIEITITNVPLSVCKNMYNTRGANVIEMKSGTTVLNGAGACEEGATVSIKFNNDLSKGSSSGGNSGSGSGNQQQTDPCDTNNPCVDECQECVSGYCQNKCTDGKVCAKGADDSTYECKKQPNSCSACTSSQYCNVYSSNNRCDNPDSGSCVDIESNSDLENMKVTITFSNDSSLDVYRGPVGSWWTAKNWCEAHGKQMVSLADLGITGGYSSGYCRNSDCTVTNWSALENAFGFGYYWVKDSYSSCHAFYVSISLRDEVASTERHANDPGPSALCK